MRVLPPNDIAFWLQAHHIEDDLPPVSELSSVEFEIPATSRGQAQLKSCLLCAMEDLYPLLVWIQGWNIWPSEEDMVLLVKFRAAYGERRPLIEAAGHEFGPEEKEECAGLVRLCLTFGWDAAVFSHKGDNFTLNHHGTGKLGLICQSKAAEAKRFLAQASWAK